MSKEIVLELLNNHGLGKVMLTTDTGKVPFKGKDGKTIRCISVKTANQSDAEALRASIISELNQYNFKSIDNETVLVSDWRNHDTVLMLGVEQYPKYCISTGRLPIEYQVVVTVNFKDVPK